MRQPTFFDREKIDGGAAAERLVLYAFGEFQSRGHALAERELPLDRLRGALRRAAEAFDVDELGDEQAASAMSALGAQVRRVPSFFAKHPYRVTVPAALAGRAEDFFRRQKAAAHRAEKS
ncbi:MAG TPA: hypothetical protein VG148_13685 [Pyrinomonadaceae bacterium]|nr:hypothetical protein [Pyrinomonadaceae bacterium]